MLAACNYKSHVILACITIVSGCQCSAYFYVYRSRVAIAIHIIVVFDPVYKRLIADQRVSFRKNYNFQLLFLIPHCYQYSVNCKKFN